MQETNLPALILGGSALTQKSFQHLDNCYASGFRAVDSARVYGGGQSEKTIGQWLVSRGHPDVQIITKGCHHDASGPRLSKKCLDEDLKTSCESLKGHVIDVYLYHRDDPNIAPEEILDWLQEYVDNGTVRSIGVSNWHHTRIDRANQWARKNGKTPFTFNSPQYSAVAPSRSVWPGCLSISGDSEAIAWHQLADSPSILAWQPLGAGFLTERPNPPTGYLSEPYESFNTEAGRIKKKEMLAFAKSKGWTLSQEAISWLIRQPKTHAIVGTSSVERWKEAMAINLS